MAKIALQKIIWQGLPKMDKDGNGLTRKIHGVDTHDPDLDRVVIPSGSPVPKIVPLKIQENWQKLDPPLVRDDPNIEAPEGPEGPPEMLLPVVDPRRII